MSRVGSYADFGMRMLRGAPGGPADLEGISLKKAAAQGTKGS
jgi:hypothetical protein